MAGSWGRSAVPPGAARSVPRPLVGLAAVLLVARIAAGVADAEHPYRIRNHVKWFEADAARAASRATGRPVLLVFTAEWCQPCRDLQSQVFGHRSSAAMVNASFVPVRVVDRRAEDGRNAPAVEVLQQRHGVQAFPTLVVVPPDESAPVTIRGFAGRARALHLLERAAARGSRATAR